ncbi:MAG: Ig-like domain-containing protein [Gemmatimonadales bacterium]
MVSGPVFRAVSCWAGLTLAAGCGERERLTFPTENPGDGSGPTTEITRPSVPDTVVVEGDLIIIQGRAYDPDGIDTVYFEVGGTNQGFSPLRGLGADTVDFALQLSTLNFSGATVLLRAYGVDLLGSQGAPVSRQIRIE